MNFELLKELGLDSDLSTKTQFAKYLELFKAYNSHTNLISKNDEKFLFEKHIFDSLALNLFFEKFNIPQTLMDIGTGGGFPSVPVSVAKPQIKIFAVDSISKKINFIKIVKQELNLKNLTPVVSRIEELPKELKSTFDLVTTRALGALPLILEYASAYLKIGGYFVAYKSIDSENELSQAKNAMKVLKMELVDEINYKLPLNENFDRKLLVFKKLNEVPDIYPRPFNIMKKNPL